MNKVSKRKALISACLIGEPCRYDGKDNKLSCLTELELNYQLFPICPEQEGGLPTPRLVAELQQPASSVLQNTGMVQRIDGADLSDAFFIGAKAALELCQKEAITLAILKERSPSCGVEQVYDGSFSGKLIPGNGVTTALLMTEQIECVSSDKITGKFIGEKNA